ncbi:TPA: hypothetical protein ACHVJ6_002898 [Bacillus cereus]
MFEHSQKIVNKYLEKGTYKVKLSKGFSELFYEIIQITSFLYNKKDFNSDLEVLLFEKIVKKINIVTDYLVDKFEGDLKIDDKSLVNIQNIGEDILPINFMVVELSFD